MEGSKASDVEVQLPEQFELGDTMASRRRILAEASERYLEFRENHLVPPYWRRTRSVGNPPYGALFVSQNNLFVLENILTGPKLETWLHMRVSRKSRRPDYNDTDFVIRDFLGYERNCYQTFPKGEPLNVVHLWSNLDSTSHVLLPDFRDVARDSTSDAE